MENKNGKSDLKIISLHKHWLIADATNRLLYSELNKNDYKEIEDSFQGKFFNVKKITALIFVMQRIAVFYALIYVVIEGFIELNLQDEELNNLLERTDCVDSLKRFRNAVFHYQKDPISPKLFEFLIINDSEIWIQTVHRAFKRFFENTLEIEKNWAIFKNETNFDKGSNI